MRRMRPTDLPHLRIQCPADVRLEGDSAHQQDRLEGQRRHANRRRESEPWTKTWTNSFPTARIRPKYLYDHESNTFEGAPKAVNKLLETSEVQAAIDKALRFLVRNED